MHYLPYFVGATFYCPHALADGNCRTWIREKMPTELLISCVTCSIAVSSEVYTEKNPLKWSDYACLIFTSLLISFVHFTISV